MDPFLKVAIDQAKKSLSEGGIPIGAALVSGEGRLLGAGHNQRVQMKSAIRHGEMDCLENVGRLPAAVYRDSTIYTTLSPCDMCSGAILLYGIGKVVIGENKTFLGAEKLLASRGVTLEVVNSPECVQMMTDFIKASPELWNEDIGV